MSPGNDQAASDDDAVFLVALHIAAAADAATAVDAAADARSIAAAISPDLAPVDGDEAARAVGVAADACRLVAAPRLDIAVINADDNEPAVKAAFDAGVLRVAVGLHRATVDVDILEPVADASRAIVSAVGFHRASKDAYLFTYPRYSIIYRPCLGTNGGRSVGTVALHITAVEVESAAGGEADGADTHVPPKEVIVDLRGRPSFVDQKMAGVVALPIDVERADVFIILH